MVILTMVLGALDNVPKVVMVGSASFIAVVLNLTCTLTTWNELGANVKKDNRRGSDLGQQRTHDINNSSGITGLLSKQKSNVKSNYVSKRMNII